MVAQTMKRSLIVLCGIFIFNLLVGFAQASTQNFSVAAGDKKTVKVDMNKGDRISGSISIIGDTINFSVTDPENEIVLSQAIKGRLEFQHTAEKTGTYNLHFENLSDKDISVALNFDVQRYIFGFPQEFIMLFIIVGIALIGIIIFVAMSPKP